MGAGASVALEASVASTPADDLAAALAGLGEEERAKLRAALAAVPAPTSESRGGDLFAGASF
jgi:hypothetical protein